MSSLIAYKRSVKAAPAKGRKFRSQAPAHSRNIDQGKTEAKQKRGFFSIVASAQSGGSMAAFCRFIANLFIRRAVPGQSPQVASPGCGLYRIARQNAPL
nr:hypothetical protein [uncultured Campylobacter sp.]